MIPWKQHGHWTQDGKLLFALSTFSFFAPNFSIIQTKYPADYSTLSALPASSPGCFVWQQRLGGIYCELSKVDVHFLNWLATSNISSPSVRFMGSKIR